MEDADINSNKLFKRESGFKGNRRGNVWTTQWQVELGPTSGPTLNIETLSLGKTGS